MAKTIGTNGLIEVWASAGTATEPSVGKITAGWQFEEQPPFETMNWIHQHLGEQFNYLMRAGVPAWNSSIEYIAGDAASFDGSIWISAADNEDSEPQDGNSNWKKVPGLDDLAAVASTGDPTDLVGVSADASELNILDGATVTTAEINFLDGVTSGVQGQINDRLEVDDKATQAEAEAGTNDTQYMTPLKVSQAVAIAVPPGAVQYFAMDAPPDGWLHCTGAAVSRSTYNGLFAAIGTTFGSGNGTSTFNIPDLRGEFIRGWDDGAGVDAGRDFGSSQLDQMQRITGSFAANRLLAATATTEGALSQGTLTRERASDSGDTSGSEIVFDSADSPNSRASDTTDGETRPRNVALLPCIKY